jgi:hypothetical protein
MGDFIYYLLILTFLAGIGVLATLILKGYFSGGGQALALFGPKPERRLDVVEQSNVDGRRRLVLVRRDDVEHLIMTGGPVDVVIETGIGQKRTRAPEAAEPAAPVFTRPPRAVSQASGDR